MFQQQHYPQGYGYGYGYSYSYPCTTVHSGAPQAVATSTVQFPAPLVGGPPQGYSASPTVPAQQAPPSLPASSVQAHVASVSWRGGGGGGGGGGGSVQTQPTTSAAPTTPDTRPIREFFGSALRQEAPPMQPAVQEEMVPAPLPQPQPQPQRLAQPRRVPQPRRGGESAPRMRDSLFGTELSVVQETVRIPEVEEVAVVHVEVPRVEVPAVQEGMVAHNPYEVGMEQVDGWFGPLSFPSMFKKGIDKAHIEQMCAAYELHDVSSLTDDKERCTVCLCDYEVGDQQRALPCMHTFHADCVDEWLCNNSQCPQCRADVVELHKKMQGMLEDTV